jgi:hypothetical protein
MIQGFSDYEKAETNGFDIREKIELGGHICKVLGVNIEQITSKKDGQVYNILNVKFDIEAPDEQAGFYNRRFAEDAKKDAMTAKWKGNYRLTIPTNASPDFAKTNWKTFITSIEKSNPGVQINGNAGFDENILVGKVFGGVFGLEEFTLPTDGRTITFARIRFVRSTEKIEEVQIPNVKLLDGSYMKYEEYMEKKDNENTSNNTTTNTDTGIIDDDSLPF